MSVTTVDAASPSAPLSLEEPPARGVDPTLDLHEEGTSDLAPATVDFESSDNLLPGEEESVEFLAPVEPEPRATPAANMPPAIGAVVNDRYLIEALIGGGGVALVYRARDMQSSPGPARNIQVALKTPRPDTHDDERARMRLSHEYAHMTRLEHPNIARALDLNVATPPFYMTMELIEGRSLTAVLRDAGRPLPSPFAQRVLRDCAAALAHAHGAGVVHGDFKPGNVFITRDQRAKVIDFGAAAAVVHTADSRIAAGTPAYASPEVLSGETPEVRDDVFSFACVAYELLTGKHPFDRRPSVQARDEGVLPPRAWALSASAWLTLLSGLSWTREQRPLDIESFVDALITQDAAAAEAAAPREVPVTPRELPDEMAPRQRGWGFFVFLACAFAVTFIAVQRRNDNDETTASEAPAGQLAPATTPLLAAPPNLMGAPTASTGLSEARVRSTPDVQPTSDVVTAAPTPAPAAAPPKKAAAPVSEIVFESTEIVTSEGSVAAVFLIKRSQPLSGRTRVRWSAISGTADAGIDFASDASGSVEFAVGQAQRAIYVPLRNDLLKEEEENFAVRLQSPQGARLGKVSKATATIRDDD